MKPYAMSCAACGDTADLTEQHHESMSWGERTWSVTITCGTCKSSVSPRPLTEVHRSLRDKLARARQERDSARDEVERLRAERDALRAMIAGRTTPPTEEEVAALRAVDGVFRYSTDDGALASAYTLAEVRWAAHRGALLWWAHDAQGRLCAWPEVTP